MFAHLDRKIYLEENRKWRKMVFYLWRKKELIFFFWRKMDSGGVWNLILGGKWSRPIFEVYITQLDKSC
jgi:hypothetical protein